MPCHQIQQGLGFKRLDQIVGRALAHRIDRTLDRAVRRHQQHRQLRLAGPQQREQLVTVHARHVDVADHQIERLTRHRRQRVFSATDRVVIVPGQQQRIGQRLAQ
ncbi:hypothetical protein D3C81_1217270 [compost metagenome]